MAALIPPWRFHGIRYHGIFSAASKDRAKACALAPQVDDADDGANPGRGDLGRGHVHDSTATTSSTARTTDTATVDADRDGPYRKRRRIEWARLLRQVFAVDVLRCHCGGERKVVAALTRGQSPDALRRYLVHIGEPVDPLPSAPARAPPQTELPLGPPAETDIETAVPPDAVDAMPDRDAHIAD